MNSEHEELSESSEPESVVIDYKSTFLNDSQFISIMKVNQEPEQEEESDKENANPNHNDGGLRMKIAMLESKN